MAENVAQEFGSANMRRNGIAFKSGRVLPSNLFQRAWHYSREWSHEIVRRITRFPQSRFPGVSTIPLMMG